MRYRTINVRVWGDIKFRALSPLKPSGQALFLYLLTNPNTTSLPGLYRAGAAAMAEELGWSTEGFSEAFGEISAQNLAMADFKSRVIFIPNAIKYNKPQSPNVVRSWLSHWDEIPECELKKTAYQILKAEVYSLGEAYAEAFAEAISKSMSYQEQDKEQDKEKSIDEVLILPMERKNAEALNEVTEIFSYWKCVMDHPRAILDMKRRCKIEQALKLGYGLEDLKQAIDGCVKTPYNMGENDSQQKFDDISLILRDAAHIERFMNNAINPPSRDEYRDWEAGFMAGVI